MVPYLKANPQITYEEAAADLGVTRKQLQQDLDQLWMCGLPGYGPGDLIDFEFSGDSINVTFTAGVDAPLRLTSPEATGLLVALRALVDIPGVVDPEAARSAIAKIESAAGTVAHDQTHAAAAVEEQAPIESDAAAAVRAAVREPARSEIEYYSASRDVLSSPQSSTRSAWCSSATTATWRPGPARPRGCGCSGSTASSTPTCSTNRPRRRHRHVQRRPGHLAVRRRPVPAGGHPAVAPTASWMLEYYPMRVRRSCPTGTARPR